MTIKEYINTNLPLSIRYNPEDKGALIGLPYPYIIPSVADMFQEMYYWDSYFANAGLIQIGDVQQAKNNVDNLRHMESQPIFSVQVVMARIRMTLTEIHLSCV